MTQVVLAVDGKHPGTGDRVIYTDASTANAALEEGCRFCRMDAPWLNGNAGSFCAPVPQHISPCFSVPFLMNRGSILWPLKMQSGTLSTDEQVRTFSFSFSSLVTLEVRRQVVSGFFLAVFLAKKLMRMRMWRVLVSSSYTPLSARSLSIYM